MHRTLARDASEISNVKSSQGSAVPPSSEETPQHTGSGLSGRRVILIVDDERPMRDLMALSLERMRYAVVAVPDGESALDVLMQRPFDLVLLDVVMPGMDGFDVLRQLRTFSNVPVVMLTALNRQEDIIRGFEAGADGYVVKPFNFKEVEARINAVVRRASHSIEGVSFDVVEFGDVKLNNLTEQVMVAGRVIDLTPTEFSLLRYLALHKDYPISKEELLESVWGYAGTDNQNLVELAVRRLRTKIEADPAHPKYVVTQRGVGYKFVANRADRVPDR